MRNTTQECEQVVVQVTAVAGIACTQTYCFESAHSLSKEGILGHTRYQGFQKFVPTQNMEIYTCRANRHSSHSVVEPICVCVCVASRAVRTLEEPCVEVYDGGEGQLLADALLQIISHVLHAPLHLLQPPLSPQLTLYGGHRDTGDPIMGLHRDNWGREVACLSDRRGQDVSTSLSSLSSSANGSYRSAASCWPPLTSSHPFTAAKWPSRVNASYHPFAPCQCRAGGSCSSD